MKSDSQIIVFDDESVSVWSFVNQYESFILYRFENIKN